LSLVAHACQIHFAPRFAPATKIATVAPMRG
jgi:hypothetical protein